MSRSDSLAKLAAFYALHRLRSRVRRSGPQMERLLSIYRPDGLRPLTREERHELPGFSRCINCGLCALTAGRIGSTHLPDLASAYLRDYPLLAEAGADLEGRRADLQAAAAACPTGVPLVEVAAMIDRLARG